MLEAFSSAEEHFLPPEGHFLPQSDNPPGADSSALGAYKRQTVTGGP